jgi:RNA polymerase sigma-70 factor (ECF subfamily)
MSESFDATTADSILVRAVRRDGSEAAFGVLYDRHTPRAFQAAWRILGGDQHAAEDAVQEAWIRAIGTLHVWRSDAAFGAWVRSIAAHVAIDALRKTQRFEMETDAEWNDPESSPDHIDLETAIASLAPGYRAVLVLHDIEGFTHEEIADRLGITAGTSKGQLFKARRAVRAALSPGIDGRRA